MDATRGLGDHPGQMPRDDRHGQPGGTQASSQRGRRAAPTTPAPSARRSTAACCAGAQRHSETRRAASAGWASQRDRTPPPPTSAQCARPPSRPPAAWTRGACRRCASLMKCCFRPRSTGIFARVTYRVGRSAHARAARAPSALASVESLRARAIRVSYVRAARHLGCIAESSGGGGISSALGSCICFGSYSVSIGEHTSASTRHVHCARGGALKSGGGGGVCGHGARAGKMARGADAPAPCSCCQSTGIRAHRSVARARRRTRRCRSRRWPRS